MVALPGRGWMTLTVGKPQKHFAPLGMMLLAYGASRRVLWGHATTNKKRAGRSRTFPKRIATRQVASGLGIVEAGRLDGAGLLGARLVDFPGPFGRTGLGIVGSGIPPLRKFLALNLSRGHGSISPDRFAANTQPLLAPRDAPLLPWAATLAGEARWVIAGRIVVVVTASAIRTFKGFRYRSPICCNLQARGLESVEVGT